MNKTHAQLACEAYFDQEIDWDKVTPLSKELWLKVAAAVLSACDKEQTHG
jgi:hypothetical protein